MTCKEEYEKCKASPYYFATNYMLVKGPDGEDRLFTTRLNEEEFNKLIYDLERNTSTSSAKPKNAGD